MIHCKSITSIIVRDEAREKQKRKCKFDEDEPPDGVILPIKIVGKEDIGLFLFPQPPGTTSAFFHQLQHPS
jgi:hypothetical protein